jgi:transposase
LVNTDASWPTPDQARGRVLEIQTKLHQRARADASRRFDDLYNLVCDQAFLTVAWGRVRSNRGARTAGVDGETAYYVETVRGVPRFLQELRGQLKARTFTPLPVRGADTVGTATRGYDAGKRINGRKRHLVTDTLGLLLLLVTVTTASVQDRDGGARVLEQLRFGMPSVVTAFADGGYAGRLVVYARQILRLLVEVVAKPTDQKGFAVLPRRWVVERTFSWIVRCRRLDRDYERLPVTAEAMIKWAMIGIMNRRIAPSPGRRPSVPGNLNLPPDPSQTPTDTVWTSRGT